MMNPSANLARPIGSLFLLAMAVSIAGNLTLLPVISAQDIIATIAGSRFQIQVFALCMLVNSVAVAAIGVLSYPVLRSYSCVVAMGYVVARTVESIVLLFGIISVLSLVSIGDQYAALDGAGSDYLLSLCKLATTNNWYAYHGAMIALGIGSLPFVYLLLTRTLIPLPLAVLGLVGYAVLAASSILAIADIDLGLVVTLPVFLFEVALGLYLIVKGFNPAHEPSQQR